jgi:effector-binding domain-containing protein
MSSEPQVVELEPVTVAALRETVPMTGLQAYYDRAFHTIMGVIQGQGVTPTGPPVGIYYSMPTDTVDMAAGFPVDREVTAESGVETTTLPAGRAVQAMHAGSYDSMTQTYDRLMAWVREQGLTPAPVMWETYLTEPSPDGDPDAMRTLITWPLQG